MNKKIKKLLIPLIAVTLVAGVGSFATNVQATTNPIDTIAKHAPMFLLGGSKKEWNDVAVINEKPLYDFDNKLVAYSVDLKSKVNGEKAYVIVSTSETDEPIIEFATKIFSPYDKITDNTQTCIYDGILNYYSKQTSSSGTKYYNIKDNSVLEDSEVKAHIVNSKDKNYSSANPVLSKQKRVQLSSPDADATLALLSTDKISNNLSVTPMASSTTKTLNVPSYQWYKGCTPTSSAMICKYTYSGYVSSVDSNTLISQLASNMYTNSSGQTQMNNIPSGVIATMAMYGKSANCYNDPYGYSKVGSTFAKYCSEIDNYYPVLVTVENNTAPTTAYSNGFGCHSVAGKGYSTYYGNYLIVNDTQLIDGDVYCNYDSAQFGTPYYTYFH